MERSCNFYSSVPGFKLVYGGSRTDTFTTYEVGSAESKNIPKTYLNLELASPNITDYNIEECAFPRPFADYNDFNQVRRNYSDLQKRIFFSPMQIVLVPSVPLLQAEFLLLRCFVSLLLL